MIDIYFNFQDNQVPLHYRETVEVTDQGIRKTGSFDSISAEDVYAMVRKDPPKEDSGLSIFNSPYGITFAVYKGSAGDGENTVGDYTNTDIEDLTFADTEGLLSVFNHYFGNYLNLHVEDDMELVNYPFEFIIPVQVDASSQE